MITKISELIQEIESMEISESRQQVLSPLIAYINKKRLEGRPVRLNFICTHNSRRSQLSQVWAAVAAAYNNVQIETFSGGVEVTAFNERAVTSLKRFGFDISSKGTLNPRYSVRFSAAWEPVLTYSKLFDAEVNPGEDFAAVMTCSHADKNCPFIPGAEARIPVRYEDPKAFDDTDQEGEMYDLRSRQIASEMLYVFANLS